MPEPAVRTALVQELDPFPNNIWLFAKGPEKPVPPLVDVNIPAKSVIFIKAGFNPSVIEAGANTAVNPPLVIFLFLGRPNHY